MNKLASLFVALLLALPATATEIVSPLPNDCTIVALEAATRLTNTKVAWVAVLSFDGFERLSGAPIGHSVCVFQITPFGQIHVYDKWGTLSLKTSSHQIKDIVSEIEKATGIAVTCAFFEQ